MNFLLEKYGFTYKIFDRMDYLTKMGVFVIFQVDLSYLQGFAVLLT